MTTALITNHTGPVTHSLADRFAHAGTPVGVLRRDTELPHGHPSDEIVMAGYEACLRRIMTDFDTVIDNRVLPPARRRADLAGLEYVRETRRILSAATTAGVRRYVHVLDSHDRRLGGWVAVRIDELLANARTGGMSTARVDIPPVFGPERGVTTELNALILRVLLGRLPGVAFGATNLLYAVDAASGVAAVALDAGCGSRSLPGSRYTFRDITSTVADLTGERPATVMPAFAARALAAVADLTKPTRGVPLPRPAFATFIADPADRASWPMSLLEADVRQTVDHFRAFIVPEPD